MTKSYKVGNILTLRRRQVTVDPVAEYQEIGIRSFGRGIFHKEPVIGAQLGNKRVFEIKPGDLVLSNVFAWEGAVALAGESEEGKIGSHRFMTYAADESTVDPQYLKYFFTSERGLRQLGQASPGSAGRNRTLAIDRFERLIIPLPHIGEQRKVARQLGRIRGQTKSVQEHLRAAALYPDSLLESARAVELLRLEEEGISSTTLESVAEIEMGQSPPGTAYNDLGEGLALLNGPRDFGPVHPAAGQWTTAVTKTCQPGDLLFCVRASIGRMNWANDLYCIGRGLAAIRARDSTVLPAFLRQMLAARVRQIMELAAGSTFLNLPGAKLARIEIPLPSLKSQKEIVRRLDVIEEKTDELRLLHERATRLRSAIDAAVLNRAFNGGK